MGDFMLNIDVEAMYKSDNEEGLVIDINGNAFKGTEAIHNVGREVYEHLKDLQREEIKEHVGINTFIEENINFFLECYKSLLTNLSENKNFILAFPDGVTLSGDLLNKHVSSSSLEDVMHMGQCVQSSLEDEMDISINIWHKSGFHAAMFFWEVNRSFDEYFQYHEPSSMLEILNDCWLHRENMNNEIFASNKKKESARKAAKSRHAETESMKEEVLKIYDENKEQYRSVADASRKLSRVVPVTDRTIDKWIRQRKKLS